MHAEISPPHNGHKVMSILHTSIIDLSNLVRVCGLFCCSLFFEQLIDAGEAAPENQCSKWAQDNGTKCDRLAYRSVVSEYVVRRQGNDRRAKSQANKVGGEKKKRHHLSTHSIGCHQLDGPVIKLHTAIPAEIRLRRLPMSAGRRRHTRRRQGVFLISW